MIQFKAKHMRDNGYSIQIPGNDGEEELLIVTSWGQDQKTNLLIVSSQCDGSVKVLHNSNKKRLALSQVITTVDNTVRKWQGTGTPAQADEQLWQDKQREKLIDKLDKLWNPTKFKAVA